MSLPCILWGSSFQNTLSIGYPLDSLISYSNPREGYSVVQTESGIEGAWIQGTDYVLEGDMRWIPSVSTSNPVYTGWNGATGVEAFLEFARNKNPIRYCPNAAATGSYTTCYLVEPMTGPPNQEENGTRSIRLVLRTPSGSFGL